jgi:NADH:ubiquinone oxidoreductase subunit 5 (subunit L)/multisubunit Na+/H+ antiporter MnhA subunit
MDVSLIGHIITALSFIGVAVYAYIRQRELHRTTRNSTLLFFIVITISLLFSAINIFRIVHELAGGQESIVTTDMDLAAQFSTIIVQSSLILVLFANKTSSIPTPARGECWRSERTRMTSKSPPGLRFPKCATPGGVDVGGVNDGRNFDRH